jgi:hypothetical protein
MEDGRVEKTRPNIKRSIMIESKRLDQTSGLKIKKAVALVLRTQNSGGSSFVAENGHGRHPDQ